jgi:hypothetical protein
MFVGGGGEAGFEGLRCSGDQYAGLSGATFTPNCTALIIVLGGLPSFARTGIVKEGRC